jgi:uncharacterized protein (TIGR03083 family)
MGNSTITTASANWLAAVDDSSRRLRDLVARMGDAELDAPSYAAEWTVAQVLSHLGSAAEIGTALLRRAVDGDASAPTQADTVPVWERWNAMASKEQRTRWVDADTTHRESLRAAAELPVRVPYFAGLLNVQEYAGYRLSEQSVHEWDVAVALDPQSTIAPAEVSLLWQRLDRVATRFRSPDVLSRLSPAQIEVRTTSPDGVYCLTLGAELHLLACEPAEPSATVRGSAEAVLRLVYGRLRDIDDVTAQGSVTLHDLQALFPGY